MNILVLNCGSSSLKFQTIETDLEVIEQNADRQLAKGVIESIGSEALITLQTNGKSVVKQATPLRDHRAALDYVVRWIISAESKIDGIQSLNDIHAISLEVARRWFDYALALHRFLNTGSNPSNRFCLQWWNQYENRQDKTELAADGSEYPLAIQINKLREPAEKKIVANFAAPRIPK